MSRMAVAIINWNTRDLLRACLRSVMAEGPGDVVVVDNGSHDGSIDMVRREFSGVQLQVLTSNPGYGAAANLAFSLCAAEHVLLLNSDTELRRGTVATLSRYLAEHPEVGIAGPRLENPDGTLQRSCFPFPSPFISLLKRRPVAAVVSRLPWLREHYPLNSAHDTDRRVPWVVGAAMAIRRTAFDAVGGFDESFVMYFEEVDLCFRMRRAGWETRFTPTATVMHVGGASTRQRRQEMLVRLSLSSLEFHRHHHRGLRLALARVVVRVSARACLVRDTLRYHLSCGTPLRERLAQDRQVWREVLMRTSGGP